MFLYAQIYWLAEFGDVSCLHLNYLRVDTLTIIIQVGRLSTHCCIIIQVGTLSTHCCIIIQVQIPPSVSTIILSGRTQSVVGLEESVTLKIVRQNVR
jgi:hypothetical protein